MTEASNQAFWIGSATDDTDVLVFDPQNQPGDQAKVRFFSVEQNDWRVFLLDIVKKRVRQSQDAETIRRAVEAYYLFEREQAIAAAEEREAREAKLEAARLDAEEWFRKKAAEEEALTRRIRERTEALNRAHLARHDISAFEYRVRSARRAARFTHCWHCKGSLASTDDLEHIVCGWLICRCGACGCGWHAT